MDNAVYVALSRQMSLFRAMDLKANNIANATTVGFNAEQLAFEPYLSDVGNGQTATFVHDSGSYRTKAYGPLKTTESPLDMAIKGRGYFTVDTPLGERYTRAGNFQLNSEGMLVTPEGHTVLDDSGQPIVFDENDREVIVGEAGNISIKNPQGQTEERGSVGVVVFENENLLERAGASLFRADVAPRAPAEGEVSVLQGVLESSNVQPVTELTDVMKISRGISSTVKLIDALYELGRRTSDVYAKQG